MALAVSHPQLRLSSHCHRNPSNTTTTAYTVARLRSSFLSPCPPSLSLSKMKTAAGVRTRRTSTSTSTKTTTTIRIRMSTTTPATERLISAVAYTLPFFNSLQYGRFLFLKYPPLGLLFEPFLPMLSLYRSLPYASFIAFFALYLGIVRNPSFSHYVRFNAMQAVTLDVLLVLPILLQRIFSISPSRAGLGFRLMMWGHSMVFVFSLFCYLYSFSSSLLGRTPYLPLVADAASRQL